MITWYGRFVRAEEQLEEYVSVSSAVYIPMASFATKGKKKVKEICYSRIRTSAMAFIYASVCEEGDNE